MFFAHLGSRSDEHLKGWIVESAFVQQSDDHIADILLESDLHDRSGAIGQDHSAEHLRAGVGAGDGVAAVSLVAHTGDGVAGGAARRRVATERAS